MVHFTCDLCGKDMTTEGDGRYVVRMEAYPGFDPNEIKEDDLDDDPMEAVSELLHRDEDLAPEALEKTRRRGFRFDLCSSCHQKFVRDPLGKETLHQFDFSNN